MPALRSDGDPLTPALERELLSLLESHNDALPRAPCSARLPSGKVAQHQFLVRGNKVAGTLVESLLSSQR